MKTLNKFFLAIWNLIKSLLIFAIYMAQLLLTMDVLCNFVFHA